MPRGHAKNPKQKSEKCRLAALGNKHGRVNKGKAKSPEHIERISLTMKGKPSNVLGKHINVKENNPNWIADRTQLVKSEKKHLDYQYRLWMLSVKNRDNWKCRIINSDCKGKLESHHILNWKDYPELRYEINNGITLCHAHHPRGRSNEAKLSPYLQKLVAEGN